MINHQLAVFHYRSQPSKSATSTHGRLVARWIIGEGLACANPGHRLIIVDKDG